MKHTKNIFKSFQFDSIEDDQPVLLVSGRIDELVDGVLAPEKTDAEMLR